MSKSNMLQNSKTLKWSLPATARLPPQTCSKWPIKWASASSDPAAESRTCMRYFFSIGFAFAEFALDLNTGSGNLSEVNKIPALITAPVRLGKLVHAVSNHSGRVPLDWWMLTSIWVAQRAGPLV